MEKIKSKEQFYDDQITEAWINDEVINYDWAHEGFSDETIKELLMKGYERGYKDANKHYDPSKILPPILPDRNYSDPVFAKIDGYSQTQVMCLVRIKNEDGKCSYDWVNCYGNLNADDEWHYFWANCYGKIDGDAEFDDNYKVIEWWPINK